MRRFAIAALLFAATPCVAAPYHGVYHHSDSAGHVLELGGLFDPKSAEGCVEAAPITGTVSKRSFAENALDVNGFVIEAPGGERTYVNIDRPNDVSMAELGWLQKGLQTMLKEGRKVSVYYWMCGAAGRVNIADRILAR